MKRFLPILVVALIGAAMPAGEASAQKHFRGCLSGTGINATVVFPVQSSPVFDGAPFNVGDEIAVFDTDGLCVGAVAWEPRNISLVLWGDDIHIGGKKGLEQGEALSFRIWDASARKEYAAQDVQVSFSNDRPYYKKEGVFAADAIYVVSSIRTRPGSGLTQGAAHVLLPTESEVPEQLLLAQNYPNPFNPSTSISYYLPGESEVQLEVVNMQGQHVDTLVSERQAAGPHAVSFDAGELPSGLYLYRLRTDSGVEIRSMLLAK